MQGMLSGGGSACLKVKARHALKVGSLVVANTPGMLSGIIGIQLSAQTLTEENVVAADFMLTIRDWQSCGHIRLGNRQ